MDFKLRDELEPGGETAEDTTPRRSPLLWIALAVVLLIGVAGGIASWVVCCSSPPSQPSAAAPAPSAPVARPRPAEPAEPPPAEPAAPRTERRRRVAPAEPAPTAAPEPVLDRGSLAVESDVSGASVFVDREYQGQTPLSIPGLSLGVHQVNVSAEGYDGIVRSVDISPGSNSIAVRFKDVTLNLAIPVVHKHGMGSCEGRLVATVEGLRYETSHRDGFSLRFSDLTKFEIDYLKKTLRLDRRGGRSYNFTDKQPTADAMFVFHRDVEKARTKLAASSAQ